MMPEPAQPDPFDTRPTHRAGQGEHLDVGGLPDAVRSGFLPGPGPVANRSDPPPPLHAAGGGERPSRDDRWGRPTSYGRGQAGATTFASQKRHISVCSTTRPCSNR